MKRFACLAAPLLFVSLLAAPFSKAQQLTIAEDSRMTIEGTSTLHGWTCEVGEIRGQITMGTAPGEISAAAVSVPSAAIDCDNATMNKKAAQALNVDAHQTIRYLLGKADVQREGGTLRVDAAGTLELAGTKKQVTVRLVGEPVPDAGFRFTGTLPIRMSDFGIDPPTAMLGTIRTGDDVTVEFEIVARDPSLSGAQ